MIIVGSTALKYNGWDVTPNDLDIWTEDVSKLPMLSCDSSEMPKDILRMIPTKRTDKGLWYATLDALYTIKLSHLQWDSGQNNLSKLGGSVQWDKYKSSVLLMKRRGCQLLPHLYEALITYWSNKFDKSFLSLKMSKDEFFTDHVEYKIDHDKLHEIVAFPNEAMYKKCLKKDEDVLIDKTLFDKMLLSEQITMFREEIGVIAIERYVVHGISYHKAWIMSLKKTITKLTKNWASRFIVEHLEDFLKPEITFIKKYEEFTMSTKNTINMEGLLEEINGSSKLNFDIEELLNPHIYGHKKEYLFDLGFKLVSQEGGGIGGAEYCYSIFEWQGILYKYEYSYYSHQGYEFNDEDAVEVTPKQKTITVYE